MRLFLSLVTVDEAVAAARGAAVLLPGETVTVEEASGRVLAADAVAAEDIPGFSRSVVDGYAVTAADTTGASEAMPAFFTLAGRVRMGEEGMAQAGRGQCTYIPTGGAMPPGTNAVAMVEYAEELGDEVLVKTPVAAGENVISRGEDFVKGEVVLHAGRRITPRDMGVLAATGNARVSVRKRPTVGIISTGNELVPPEVSPGPGMVRDANSYLCAGFVETRGGMAVTYGIVPDDLESLREALDRAVAACDMVMISGGSSKDARDNTAAVIAELGEVLIHGIALSPGKPTIIGKINGKPVLGLPGHPASAFVVLTAIAGEVLFAMTGEDRAERTVTATLTQNISSARGREDYVRVVLEGRKVTPVFGKSGLLNTLVQSSGIVRVPASREGLETGEAVEVILW